MKYPFELDGFEGHELAVEIPGIFAGPRLLLDGTPVPKPIKGLQYSLTRDDGELVVIELMPVQLGSMLLVAAGTRVIPLMKPLAWHEWLFAALPFVLVTLGGCVGGAIGGACTMINLRIFRAVENVPGRYILSALVAAIAVGAYVAIVGVLLLLGMVAKPAWMGAAAPPSASFPSTSEPSTSTGLSKASTPVQAARDLMTQGAGYSDMALGALKGAQDAEALDFLLSLLEIPPTTSDPSPKIIKALGEWKTDHDRIAEALVTQFPVFSHQGKTEAIRVLSEWDMKRHSPELFRAIFASKDFRLHDRLVEPLMKIITPECNPILLANLETLRRNSEGASLLLLLLNENPDPAAMPQLLEHLNNQASFSMWRPASVALGRLGTEEAIAAIEAKLQEHGASNEDHARMFRAGLHRTHHPRGRAVLAESLKSQDVWTRADAADGLAETARAEDAPLVATALADPHPQIRLRTLPAVPRLLPDARTSVEAMYDAAVQAGRHRTALSIAESLGDKDRIARATEGLKLLRQTMMQEPRLDQWFGKRKDDLKKEFPDGELKYGSLELITFGPGGSRSSRSWYFVSKSAGLRMSTRGFGDTPCDDVSVFEGYSKPAYGIRLGDSADTAWEILGGIEQNKGLWGAFTVSLKLPDGKQTHVRWALDRQDKVSSIGVTSSKK